MERLLEFFTPITYQLSLHINKHSELVQGKVIITGKPHAQKIKFHANNLKISAVHIDRAMGPSPDFSLGDPRPLQFSQQGDLLTVDLPEQAPTTDIRLEVKYSFKLQRNMEGAYLSTYRHQGREERVVATQFESHYARACFPCIDEPAAKATFDLKLIIPDPEDTVISNTPVRSEKTVIYDSVDANFQLGQKTTKKIVIFETTPRMSTYLVAFCIGKFHHKSTKSHHGVEITSYCALNQDPALLDFSNQIAADALDYYDDLFQTKYPLKKLDQVALPDFEAGAMENWGLVTYRESCMLATESSPISTKSYVATVIAHELSHQWFGNLVTMNWWDDLWLNESFANVLEYYCVDKIRPDFRIWEDFFTGDCVAALDRDALPGVQAVQQPVENPADIATLFDGAIVYAKGARLMLMLIRLMGEKQFFSGIKDYFDEHQYQNTVGDDLWAALQPYAEFDIKDFMHAWISQPGYPVLKGHEQKRFLITGQSDRTKWPLPTIQNDMSGHYLIQLSDVEFASALQNFVQLSLEQRLRLLIDRRLLARTPLISSASLIPLVQKFRHETSYPVWGIIAGLARSLRLFVESGTEDEQNLHAFFLELIGIQSERLGVSARSQEPDNDTKLRPLILALGLAGKDTTLAAVLAKLYQPDFTLLDPNTRYAVLQGYFDHHQEKPFVDFLSRYKELPDPDLKSDLLSVIASAEQSQNTSKLMALLKNPDTIRPQDHLYFFASLLKNPQTKARALAWLPANWDYVKGLSGDKTLDDYLRVTARAIKRPDEAAAFFAFADKFADTPGLSRAVAIAHQDITARLELVKSDTSEVLEALKSLR